MEKSETSVSVSAQALCGRDPDKVARSADFLLLRIVSERCGMNEHAGGLAGVGSFKPGSSAP